MTKQPYFLLNSRSPARCQPVSDPYGIRLHAGNLRSADASRAPHLRMTWSAL